MDERTWRLSVATLGSAVALVLVDAVLVSFDVPSGFWTVLAALFGMLGARSAFKNKGDENGNA